MRVFGAVILKNFFHKIEKLHFLLQAVSLLNIQFKHNNQQLPTTTNNYLPTTTNFNKMSVFNYTSVKYKV